MCELNYSTCCAYILVRAPGQRTQPSGNRENEKVRVSVGESEPLTEVLDGGA